jgi:hypothetical protein
MAAREMRLTKSEAGTSHWRPLETGTVEVADARAARVTVADGARRVYLDRPVRPGRRVRFRARGSAGIHVVSALDGAGTALSECRFVLRPQTEIRCDRGPYGRLAEMLRDLMVVSGENQAAVVDGKLRRFLVSWGRDHTHVLKAMKYFMADVKSGIEFYLERQRPNGMLWDDCHRNQNRPHPSWFGEALGDGYWGYSRDMEYTFRRIPVEADVEFLYTECVYYAWKASGDDAWLAAQMLVLEKALRYNTSDPTRWSRKHGLVKRSFCMDSWDFANPHFCAGDHRCIHPGDPQFLFHSDNSGLYASHWRMAEMHEALGNRRRAAQLRRAGEALRERANRKLFFDTNYGHMIPELLPEEEVYELVGDERRRMSLSTGYTINRGLPTHEMAVAILKEYRRRGRRQQRTSFAEWWSMDPPYSQAQWPDQHCTPGHYMNGSIGLIIAGELAKAAYDHGCEEYGTDILRRVWRLAERDGGYLHSTYLRLPEEPAESEARFRFVDLRAVANVGLRDGASGDVVTWTDEGENDMRDLPTGRRAFGAIRFEVIDPATNEGRAAVGLDAAPGCGARHICVPVGGLEARSIYFMHALAHSAPPGAVVGTYDVCYADGTEERIHVRNGHEIGLWWGISDNAGRGEHAVDRRTTRVAWQGANGEWKNVGLFMTGWNNPRPEVPVTAIRMEALPAGGRGGGIMLAAISLSDQPVRFDTPIRSGGWPASWSHASVYYSIAEGLAGVEDTGRAFGRADVSPRWAATEAKRARAELHYPASDGYCAYEYRHDPKRRRIVLDVTGSFESARVHCLLPAGVKAARVHVDGTELPSEAKAVERSRYVDFALDGLPAGAVTISY